MKNRKKSAWRTQAFADNTYPFAADQGEERSRDEDVPAANRVRRPRTSLQSRDRRADADRRAAEKLLDAEETRKALSEKRYPPVHAVLKLGPEAAHDQGYFDRSGLHGRRRRTRETRSAKETPVERWQITLQRRLTLQRNSSIQSERSVLPREQLQ